MQYLSSPLECQLLEDTRLIWLALLWPALRSRQYLLSTCYLGAPGVGCGDTGGNQTDTPLSSGADSNTQGLFVEPLLGCAQKGKEWPGPLPFTQSLQVLHQVSGLTSGSFYPALFEALLLSDDPFRSGSPLSQAISQWRDPQCLPLASRRKPTSWSHLLCSL